MNKITIKKNGKKTDWSGWGSTKIKSTAYSWLESTCGLLDKCGYFSGFLKDMQ
jgi:hypothetical protein